MKKLLSILLIAVMVLSVVACAASGDKAGATGDKKHKIGVANIHQGETWEIAKTYLETVVAPALNFEFVISETLSDANGLIAFMEQCYAAGCEGMINMVTSSDAISQGAHKAQDWGMWFTTQNSMLVPDVAELSYNVGHVGADPAAVGAAYKAAFADYLSDGEPHSVYLFSGAAVGGDKGQGAASHFDASKGILEAFQEAYGLDYGQPIADIINNQNPGKVETGNPDINIYIYPGRVPSDAVTAALPVLQTGDYDIFAAVFSFASFTNAISDVETALGKDIKVVGTAQIEKQTKTGFETNDPTGDTVLNSAILNNIPVALGINSIMLKQAFEGRVDNMKEDGKTVLLGVRSWPINGAEMYARIEKLDTTPELYLLNAEELTKLSADGITWKDLENKLIELGDIETVLKDKGL